jgi:hypothetical protein
MHLYLQPYAVTVTHCLQSHDLFLAGASVNDDQIRPCCMSMFLSLHLLVLNGEITLAHDLFCSKITIWFHVPLHRKTMQCPQP